MPVAGLLLQALLTAPSVSKVKIVFIYITLHFHFHEVNLFDIKEKKQNIDAYCGEIVAKTSSAVINRKNEKSQLADTGVYLSVGKMLQWQAAASEIKAMTHQS